MKLAIQINQGRRADEIVAALRGLKCWDVACGGAAGSSFQLALGGKVPRVLPLRNPKASEAARRFEGEFGLMVWCSWRLESGARPITSSEDESPNLVRGLRRLAGKAIVGVSVLEGWFLQLSFTGGLRLVIFPDHVGRGWTLGNWEVWTPDREYEVGTDLLCQGSPRRIEHRAAAKVSIRSLARQKVRI